MIISNPQSDAAADRALAGGTGAEVQAEVTLKRPWRDRPDSVLLQPRYAAVPDAGELRLRAHVDGHELFLDAPVALEAVHVPKPWGQEIWLTGIEARGESTVRTAAGTLPLSQYLALAPRRLTGGAPLVLLKVLAPRAEPVLGDLYFETHEQKQEVYVVTRVDPAAWPDGHGRIRFGMDQRLRAEYGDDDRFRADYLAAVQHYERIRRAIDAGEAVSGDEEARRRAAMEAFTDLRKLAVGDVVVVPTWLPHSLQHGVRVIEFQTPSYERYIISFAQQVLTQDHWDTEAAVPRMRLDAPPPPTFAAVADGVETIVSFDDFRVWRVTLPGGAELPLPTHPSYALCMGVRGEAGLDTLRLGPEQAAFVPGAALRSECARRRATLRNVAAEPAVVLIAAPDL